MDAQTSFDRYAISYEEKFNRNPLGRFQRRQVRDFLFPWLQGRENILDVGCGPGSDFEFYRLLDCRLTAIDISEQMTRLAKEKALRLRMAARIENSGIEEFSVDEKYDAVVCNFGVLNAVENLPVALAKIRSLMTENGVLVAVVMPPLQITELITGLLRMRRETVRRLFGRKAQTGEGFNFRYIRKTDLEKKFKISAHRNLGVLLPAPDRFAATAFWKSWSRVFLPFEKIISRIVPAWLGGDHVCYILKPEPDEEVQA